MRLNDSKNKRILIMEQISIREKSREKQRKSSAERRRKIEENLNDFMKTMSNVSFRNTGNSSGFRYEQEYSQRHDSYEDVQKPKQTQKQTLRQEYNQVLRSPSFKDINLGVENESRMDLSNQSLKYSNLGQVEQKPKDKQENKVEEQQIAYRNDSSKAKKQIENLTLKSIVQNESSASAIFFTSQFNEFISKNHISSREKLQPTEITQQKELNLHQNEEKPVQELYNNQINKSQKFYEVYTPQNQQSPKKEPLNIDLNQQILKQYHISEIQSQVNPIPQTLQQERKSTLMKNKSGHSLAFSNQSSLKYSLNESNIKQILNRKFANQLIADTIQFDHQHQDSSLYYHLKLQIIGDKYLASNKKMFFEKLILFTKIFKLSKKVQKREKRIYFQAFIINQELIFQEKKNQIICDKYLQEKQQLGLKRFFEDLKFNFFTLPRSKTQKSIQFEQNRQKQTKQKIFRCLKIAWFDQKVKKQIQLYYLSKLFSHFSRVLKAQKQIKRNKSLSFYCQNLKRRYFKHLKEGVDNLQTERIQRDNASWHYAFGLQKKVFDAWKNRLSYKDAYISLTMTTKNTFKENGDQKWLQIKTVDFRQIKYQ